MHPSSRHQSALHSPRGLQAAASVCNQNLKRRLLLADDASIPRVAVTVRLIEFWQSASMHAQEVLQVL
jgi:hypothetical protein